MIDELAEIGLHPRLATCFTQLPIFVSHEGNLTQECLFNSFLTMFRCKEAKIKRGVVFIWTIDDPYHHANTNLKSRISYIEKTDQTISARWSKRNVTYLTTDQAEGDIQADLDDLRPYANANRNYTFYSRLIKNHGPLRIWWSSCSTLNENADRQLNAREWEAHLLALYFHRYQCLPLKNRRR